MSATVSNIALASVTPVLTTVFAPTATGCSDGSLTMLANRGYQIWNNIPVPVAGTTFTDCLPSQYISSFLLSAGGVTQPAFAPLVCPQSWTTIGPFTSNYIACCPSGYKFANPTVSVQDERPAFGGTCYSDFTKDSSYLVTFYGSSSVTGTSYYTETATTDQAFAYPIDGYAYGVAALQSVSTTSGIATKTSGSSTTTATSTSTAQTTHEVVITDATAFSPDNVAANIGDIVEFRFNSSQHTVTESSFGSPCTAGTATSNFDSGFPAVGSSNLFNVTSVDPQYFYSRGSGDCAAGMVFMINPATSGTYSFSNFQYKAINSVKTAKSHGVAIGVGVGVGLAAIISLVAGFFLWRRNRQRKAATHSAIGSDVDHAEEQQMEPKTPAMTQTEMDTAKLAEMPLRQDEGHELHSYATPYEMGGGHHYEMEGSNQFKR